MCNAGLSCASNVCVNPNSQGAGGSSTGGGSGVDVQACTSCWESACGAAYDACTAASPCGEVADCALGCIAQADFETCPQNCVTGAEGASQEASLAYTDLWTCAATSCASECFTIPSTGTGGAQGIGGTGAGGGTGTGGAGTGGGMTFLPPTEELRPLDGWVHIEENTVGVQGAIYTFSDPLSSISPATFESSGRSFCVSGQATQVPCTTPDDCDYSTYWGVGAGMNLNEPPGGVPGPYNATAAGVTGISFDITGATVPLSMRFKAVVAGDSTDYCTGPTLEPRAGTNFVLLSDLSANCYEVPAGGPPNASQLEAIQWQVFTNSQSAVPFDFCISNIRAQ